MIVVRVARIFIHLCAGLKMVVDWLSRLRRSIRPFGSQPVQVRQPKRRLRIAANRASEVLETRQMLSGSSYGYYGSGYAEAQQAAQQAAEQAAREAAQRAIEQAAQSNLGQSGSGQSGSYPQGYDQSGYYGSGYYGSGSGQTNTDSSPTTSGSAADATGTTDDQVIDQPPYVDTDETSSSSGDSGAVDQTGSLGQLDEVTAAVLDSGDPKVDGSDTLSDTHDADSSAVTVGDIGDWLETDGSDALLDDLTKVDDPSTDSENDPLDGFIARPASDDLNLNGGLTGGGLNGGGSTGGTTTTTTYSGPLGQFQQIAANLDASTSAAVGQYESTLTGLVSDYDSQLDDAAENWLSAVEDVFTKFEDDELRSEQTRKDALDAISDAYAARTTAAADAHAATLSASEAAWAGQIAAARETFVTSAVASYIAATDAFSSLYTSFEQTVLGLEQQYEQARQDPLVSRGNILHAHHAGSDLARSLADARDQAQFARGTAARETARAAYDAAGEAHVNAVTAARESANAASESAGDAYVDAYLSLAAAYEQATEQANANYDAAVEAARAAFDSAEADAENQAASVRMAAFAQREQALETANTELTASIASLGTPGSGNPGSPSGTPIPAGGELDAALAAIDSQIGDRLSAIAAHGQQQRASLAANAAYEQSARTAGFAALGLTRAASTALRGSLLDAAANRAAAINAATAAAVAAANAADAALAHAGTTIAAAFGQASLDAAVAKEQAVMQASQSFQETVRASNQAYNSQARADAATVRDVVNSAMLAAASAQLAGADEYSLYYYEADAAATSAYAAHSSAMTAAGIAFGEASDAITFGYQSTLAGLADAHDQTVLAAAETHAQTGLSADETLARERTNAEREAEDARLAAELARAEEANAAADQQARGLGQAEDEAAAAADAATEEFLNGAAPAAAGFLGSLIDIQNWATADATEQGGNLFSELVQAYANGDNVQVPPGLAELHAEAARLGADVRAVQEELEAMETRVGDLRIEQGQIRRQISELELQRDNLAWYESASAINAQIDQLSRQDEHVSSLLGAETLAQSQARDPQTGLVAALNNQAKMAANSALNVSVNTVDAIQRLAYTGDAYASDDVYNAALDEAVANLGRPGVELTGELTLDAFRWVPIVGPIMPEVGVGGGVHAIYDWGTGGIDFYGYGGPAIAWDNNNLPVSVGLGLAGTMTYGLPTDEPLALTGWSGNVDGTIVGPGYGGFMGVSYPLSTINTPPVVDRVARAVDPQLTKLVPSTLPASVLPVDDGPWVWSLGAQIGTPGIGGSYDASHTWLLGDN